MSDRFDFSSLFDEFRDEAQEQVARLDAALLELEEEGELADAARDELLRSLHTLKGNSGMLGLARMADAVHLMETVFRAPPARWEQPTLDALFAAAAALRRAVERVGSDEQEDALERLAAVRLPTPDRPRETASEPGVPALSPSPPRRSDASGRPPRSGAARPEEAVPRTPPAPAPEPDPDAPDEAGRFDAASEVLRVPFAMLDSLLNGVGELIAANAALDERVDASQDALERIGMRRALREHVETMDQLIGSVRRTTMGLRLVPVGRVLSRFPSLARDLARQQGKQVRVELEGESVELDKSTVDALGEPLLHLVRNAVDHAIGTPEERRERNKPEAGTLVIRAARRGDRVHIEVSDDGEGLDRARILARARESGLISPGDTPSDGQIDEIVFAPGFSTRSAATTVSGRGIGLEVVRQRVSALRGSLSVESEPGRGTRFVLQLPLTLAIVPALLFRSCGETLALPAAEVEEALASARTEHAGGAEVLRHRGELVPVARPAELFGWTDADGPRRRRGFAIVVRLGARAAALMADDLLEQRDVMVKGLPLALGTQPAVSGVAVAPDGRPILLLDVAGIMDLNLSSHRKESRGRSR